MTNMLFAPADATVIEFGMEPHVDRSFGYMAMALGLEYWLVPQVSAFYFFNYKMSPEKADLVVRLVKHVISKRGYGLLSQLGSSANDKVSWNVVFKT